MNPYNLNKSQLQEMKSQILLANLDSKGSILMQEDSTISTNTVGER
jgi:hypothetical protein